MHQEVQLIMKYGMKKNDVSSSFCAPTIAEVIVIRVVAHLVFQEENHVRGTQPGGADTLSMSRSYLFELNFRIQAFI